MKNIKEFLFFIILIFVGILCFLLGYYKEDYTLSNVEIYFEDEKQIFRDKDGNELNVLEKDDIFYMPIGEIGVVLRYMPIFAEDGIYLYDKGEIVTNKLLNGFETETIDGELINSDIFEKSKYTIIFLWTPDCRYCIEEINDWSFLNNYFKENNIQLLGLNLILAYENFATGYKISEEERVELVNIFKDLDVDYHIYMDDIIKDKLIGSAIKYPKTFIFDSQGNMIKLFDNKVTSEELKGFIDRIV